MTELAYLARREGDDHAGTEGRLYLPCGFECFTLELPWHGNRVGESCIPAGEYALRVRRSNVVEHASGGEFRTGYEIADVPDRTLIMLHPGNHIGHSDGCLLPGTRRSRWHVDEFDRAMPTVANSRRAFRELMQRLGRQPLDAWRLRIAYNDAEAAP